MDKIKITNEIKTIFVTLKNFNYECFMVGGCVRDFLLHKSPHDVDFATNATPEQMKQCFKGFKVIETGLKHGTLTIMVNNIPFEITTYRVDGEYLDHRHPKKVEFITDLKGDLARRDFTINAIAYNPEVGFVDYFNGIQDLNNKTIRCVNEPLKRLNEDALRILRALRFSAVLNYEIEEKTKEACFKQKHLLKNISCERICSELFKTIVQPNADKIMLEYVDIWGEVIPELKKMKGFEQHNPHHVHDVLTHTCVALSKASDDLTIRLAVLFHDIGKPDSFFMDEKGVGHFYGHAIKSVDLTRGILERLKVDNNTKKQVLTLIKYHDLDLQASERYIRRLGYKLGDLEMVKNLVLLQRADNYGQAPIHSERIEKFDKIDKIIKKLENDNLTFSLKDLNINGRDLIEIGLIGKEIGSALHFLLKSVIMDKVKNEKGELLSYLKINRGSYD